MKYLIILSFTFLINSSFYNTASTSDSQAQKILKKVAETYKAFKTIKSTFKASTTDRKSKVTTTSGTLWTKGEKFKLEYGGQTIYCNGKFTWTYNPTDEEVTKEKYKAKSNSISPTDIFNIYKKDFKNVYEGSSVVNAKKNHVIKMAPKKVKNYAYLKLYVDETTNKITQLYQYFKNGTSLTISIDKFEPNTALTDADFEWNKSKHPGVVEVDLTK